ncbi:ATP-grasp domain-containing protein [Sphingomicrobium clamense]|uniref:ATP-grasp domain-containing protein n=1 Tax=Sphingomicrobium clamense TaxID=2851013 RepID=A0ABS6V3X7_9SPHN|nr:hypothetical protein [Sphingomicrobium sp. B8]MBW0144206.1 hypothetical protein [Sphingomicrobium sp. B8]
MKVAILVPAAWDDDYYVKELEKQVAMLAEAGIEAVAVEWDKASDDVLRGVDGVAPLIAWGYHLEPGRWFDLLDRIDFRKVPCANPVPVLRWNSDKAYLEELGDKGVPTVPSLTGHSDDDDDLMDRARRHFADAQEFVVKPLVSASAAGTHRIARDAALPDDAAGKRMLVQPFQPEILKSGEMSLIYFGGDYSHAAIKTPKDGDYRVQPEFGGGEVQVDAPDSARKVAEAALAAAPGDTAYARVDLVSDGNDGWLLMELELVEPDLFLRYAPDGGAFASALKDMLSA